MHDDGDTTEGEIGQLLRDEVECSSELMERYRKAVSEASQQQELSFLPRMVAASAIFVLIGFYMDSQLHGLGISAVLFAAAALAAWLHVPRDDQAATGSPPLM
jgi:hypothetical protein